MPTSESVSSTCAKETFSGRSPCSSGASLSGSSRTSRSGSSTEPHTSATRSLSPVGLQPVLARCHWVLARLLRGVARRPAAYPHLDTAAALFQDMDMRYWSERVEADRAFPG